MGVTLLNDKKKPLSRMSQWRADNPERYADYYYNVTFGITRKDYVRLFEKQQGLCAICRQPETHKINGKIKILSVDHCHITGKIRGLLCDHCNKMLGFARDKAETLRIAATYLEVADAGIKMPPQISADELINELKDA